MFRKPFYFILLVVMVTTLIAQSAGPVPKLKAETRITGYKIDPPSVATQDAQFERRRNQAPTPEEEKMLKEQRKQQNKERFESLKKDTEKLLTLANELKQNVDKANENMLSLDVIKKTEEIEKLAKKVHDKMTTSY